jgi:hypothetical protein
MRRERQAMLKPLDKPTRRPLIHHPSDVLDSFCHFDNTSSPWRKFDENLSGQIVQFEADHPQYLRPQSAGSRRTTS